MDAAAGGSEGVEPMDKTMRKTPFQLNILEKTYAGNAYPTKKVRAKLSVQLDLTDRQLQKWFYKRRLKDRKKPNKVMNVNDDDSPEWAQALEPVRKLPTNVGARIKRCIYESLNRNPPEWAREILEHSISEEVYKGNASGPTKRAVISVLEKVRVDILQSKPTEKKENEKSGLRTLYEEEIGCNTGRTKERAWRTTNTHTPKKKLKQTRKRHLAY
ncbi:hypothetical protein M8C21_016304 [Ambrosia artemisiifolia]|uniref:Homeobox domain-containing protein n=1 Tax=Ambrosia artemisiifolia TaxID=4212 RepID=A0AAD5GL08_AMBAR|nr:hypothetical protein M8C21_016304 [Ambrosia artemisiifolia]